MKFKKFISSLSNTNKIIISDQNLDLTGIELAAKIYQTAEELKYNGFGDGKIVIYRMANNIDCVVTFLALVLCKCSVFISNPHDPIQRYYDNIDRFKPFALLADLPSTLAIAKRCDNENNHTIFNLNSVSISANIFSNNQAALESYDPKMKEANVAIFSSGSTGEPKAILHNIDNLLINASKHIEAVGLRESDVMGITLPLYYSYGLVANLLASLIIKARISLHYQSGTIDCDWIVRDKITFIGITPYFAGTLKKTVQGLRVITLGGDILHADLALQLMNDFPNCQFFSTYGLTEAGPRVATWKFDKEILNNCEIAPLGKPLRGVKLMLKDEFGNKSDSGELILETNTRMLGYYFGVNNGFSMPEKNDCEVHTDDLFEKRESGFYFVGRKKHIIIQGGEKIFPIAVESALQKIEGVIDAKVGSVSDIEKGIVAKAYIVADNSISLASINRILLSKFTRSLIPAQFEFVDSIARTLTGKIA